MKVRVIKEFLPYTVGHIIPEMPGNAGRMLVERGLVEEVKEFPSPVDRMMRSATTPRQQRGGNAR